MSRPKTALQKHLSNTRKTLRQYAEKIARAHRSCPQDQECGCIAEQATTKILAFEHDLFGLELASLRGEAGKAAISKARGDGA